MRLISLKLTNFRNHTASQFATNSSCQVFLGDNGAGKTNILEAISFLSPGRGMRRSIYDKITQNNCKQGWSVFATLADESSDDYGDIKIGTGYHATNSGRRVRVNNAELASSESLLDYCRVNWLTPAMDDLFTGATGNRRRYLDRMVLAIDPQHGRRVRDYEKVMSGRNRLLEENSQSAYLDAVETQIAELGTAIAYARSDLVSRLQHIIHLEDKNSPFPSAGLRLVSELDEDILDPSAIAMEDIFKEKLAQNRFKDRASGRMLFGPHRSDLEVSYSAKSMPAAQASTGEQKGLLISMFLAHASLTLDQSSIQPILLLDEIAAHLDEHRRQSLFEKLYRSGAQFIMTGTDPQAFSNLSEADFFWVQDGNIFDEKP